MRKVASTDALSSASADGGRTFPELLAALSVSVDQVVSSLLAGVPRSGTLTAPILFRFSRFVERVVPILRPLEPHEVAASVPLRKAVESLDAEMRRSWSVVRSAAGSVDAVRSIEGCVHDLGRCLGLVLLATAGAPADVREAIGALQKGMMAVRFESLPPLLSKPPSPFKVERVVPDLEDVVLRVRSGGGEEEEEEELGAALEELGFLIREGLIGEGGGSVVAALLNRLGSAKKDGRLKIILLLRSLASQSEDNKEKMADIRSLSTLVRSLIRDIEERREAVGLLLDLSDIQRVRQRIGRVQGCIVMLVALLNGDDPCASCDAGKLLDALSNNTQNVLLMAEAGYFTPLVQYIKEGSDMNKILMATAISRMELTDQMKASLGDEGSIEPLVKMFTSGKLEAKLSALGALRNLSTLKENIPRLIISGIVRPLLQLLFSVTSVLLTLREPAAAILACISQSELILMNKTVAQQMFSLLNLSSPMIQYHLLQALNSIAGHPGASKVRNTMKETGAVQLLLPFLTENTEIRPIALNLLFNLSKDLGEELTEQLGDIHLNVIANIISTSDSEDEKAAACGILCNVPVSDKKVTEILKRLNLLPVIVSLLEASITTSSVPSGKWLLESISGIIVRFTVPWDKKLQRLSAELGVIPLLVKLLSNVSPIVKCRAAISLAQLSQNSLALSKAKVSRWMCVPSSLEAFCEVHSCKCTIRTTFCIIKAGSISPLIQILEGIEREADEAVLSALSTLMQDEIWENGSNVIEKAAGIQAIIRMLEVGSVKAQERAIWMLERIFRVEKHKRKYGSAAQILLIDLAQKGDLTLKPMIAKILAHLQLLHMQSSYF